MDLIKVFSAGAAVGSSAATVALCLLGVGVLAPAWAQDKPVYRCPGNLYTDALSAREAAEKGCKTLEGAPITVIQSQMPRTSATAPKATASGGGSDRVSADEQKSRDADARRILEAELKKEEEALAALQKEFNNGQPERRGDERNYQKYTERVAEMKNAITRKEADIASIKRELAKLGGGSAPAPTAAK